MKIEIRRIGLNGLEGKKPNRTWSVQTSFRFGSVQKLEKNNFSLVIYFVSKPDRTENAHP